MFGASRKTTIRSMLDDPLIQMMMKADSVPPEKLEAMLRDVADDLRRRKKIWPNIPLWLRRSSFGKLHANVCSVCLSVHCALWSSRSLLPQFELQSSRARRLQGEPSHV